MLRASYLTIVAGVLFILVGCPTGGDDDASGDDDVSDDDDTGPTGEGSWSLDADLGCPSVGSAVWLQPDGESQEDAVLLMSSEAHAGEYVADALTLSFTLFFEWQDAHGAAEATGDVPAACEACRTLWDGIGDLYAQWMPDDSCTVQIHTNWVPGDFGTYPIGNDVRGDIYQFDVGTDWHIAGDHVGDCGQYATYTWEQWEPIESEGWTLYMSLTPRFMFNGGDLIVSEGPDEDHQDVRGIDMVVEDLRPTGGTIELSGDLFGSFGVTAWSD